MNYEEWEYAGEFESVFIYNKTGGGWIYIYKKGCFRDQEDKCVLSVSYTGGSNPKDRKDISFKSLKEAKDYALVLMGERQ